MLLLAVVCAGAGRRSRPPNRRPWPARAASTTPATTRARSTPRRWRAARRSGPMRRRSSSHASRLERYRQTHERVGARRRARGAAGGARGGAHSARSGGSAHRAGPGAVSRRGVRAGGGALRHRARQGHACLGARAIAPMLLDWWATALDREAQKLPSDRRPPVYQRIGDRMDRELRDDPANGVANYWQVVAARGVGDLDRAWSAAIAGWVRSTLDPAGDGAAARATSTAWWSRRSSPSGHDPTRRGRAWSGGNAARRVVAREAELEVTRGGDRAGRCRAGDHELEPPRSPGSAGPPRRRRR